MQVETGLIITFPGLVCISLGLSQPLFFSPAYLAFYIASEQHDGLVQRGQLLFPIDNLEWFHFAEVSERQNGLPTIL